MKKLSESIPRRSRSCTECGHAFAPHQHYFTLLFASEEEEEAWVRADCCATCWEAQREQLLTASYRWRGAVPAPPAREQRAPETWQERLLAYLVRLLEQKEYGRALLLALFLERRRVLERGRARHCKGDVWVAFKVRSGEATFLLPHSAWNVTPSSGEEQFVAELQAVVEVSTSQEVTVGTPNQEG